MSRAALAASCLVAALSIGSPARADEGVVTVVRTRESARWIDEATSRVAGELRAVGFRVRVVERGRGGVAPVDASREIATVAIVATPAGAEVDVWIADNVSDKVRVKRVVEADASAPNAASDLAVRSVELQRATLLEATPRQRAALAPPVVAWLDAAPPVSSPPSASPPEPVNASSSHHPPSASRVAPASFERASAPPPSARSAAPFDVTAQAAFGILSGAGAGLAVAPLGRVGIVHRSGVGARVTAAAALATTRTGASGATVDVRQTLVAFDATYAFAPPSARLAPRVGGGGGVFVLAADGHAALPDHGLHPRFATGFVDAGAALALRLQPWLALVAEVDALVMPTEPEVTVDGKSAFQTGRPTVLASLGLEAHF